MHQRAMRVFNTYLEIRKCLPNVSVGCVAARSHGRLTLLVSDPTISQLKATVVSLVANLLHDMTALRCSSFVVVQSWCSLLIVFCWLLHARCPLTAGGRLLTAHSLDKISRFAHSLTGIINTVLALIQRGIPAAVALREEFLLFFFHPSCAQTET